MCVHEHTHLPESVTQCVHLSLNMVYFHDIIPSDGVDRDSGGGSGHGPGAGIDTETKCLSQFMPGVLIHLHCPDPPCLTVSHTHFQLVEILNLKNVFGCWNTLFFLNKDVRLKNCQ